MNNKPGRNSPCPCGSGKKYKKCCGLSEIHELRIPDDLRSGTPFDDYQDVFTLVGLFGQKIIRFDKEGPELKKAGKSFEKRYRPGRPGGLNDSFFMSWLHFDCRFGRSGKTVVERVLDDPLTAGLSEPGPTLLKHMADSYLSFYQVMEPGPEATVVEELDTGARFKVFYVRELLEIEPTRGEIWFTRLIGPRDHALSYTTPYIYEPETRGLFDRAVRAQTKEYFVSPRSVIVQPERLFAESRKEFALFWAEYIHVAETGQREAFSQVPAVAAPRLPRIVNEDGDEILLTTMYFRITDKSCLRKKLAGLKTFVYDKNDDSWTWLKAKRRLDPEAPRVELGFFRIMAGRLVAETNSRERAARLEWKLTSHLGKLIVLERTTYRRMEDLPRLSEKEWEAMRKEDEEFNARPEVREALRREMERRYFKEWPRSKIPALGGLTPLQAAKTEDGRKKLNALLAFYDRKRKVAHSPMSDLDTDALRRMLGLLPRVN